MGDPIMTTHYAAEKIPTWKITPSRLCSSQCIGSLTGPLYIGRFLIGLASSVNFLGIPRGTMYTKESNLVIGLR
jgi:hypothetical protein